MLKKYQKDSHVIYGTLIFIKYPLITRESRLFAEIRIIYSIEALLSNYQEIPTIEFLQLDI